MYKLIIKAPLFSILVLQLLILLNPFFFLFFFLFGAIFLKRNIITFYTPTHSQIPTS